MKSNFHSLHDSQDLLIQSAKQNPQKTKQPQRFPNTKNTNNTHSPNQTGTSPITPSPPPSFTEEHGEHDEKSGQDFLREIQENPENIKQLLEEFITIISRYEKDVKDAKALYEWLIETLPQAIWVYNHDGSFFYRNSHAIEISPILESIPNLKTQQSAPIIQLQTEVEYAKKIFLIQTNSFQNRLLITATDITTQKRQARLASMGQISAHLAHEIRNPIGSISILAGLLQKSAQDPQLPIIDELQKSIFRVERIIKATLLFSKGISAHKSPVRIFELQDELDAFVRSYSFSKHIDFSFEFVDKIAYLDRDLILIALQNFLFNAIDAIEEGENESGQVIIRAQIVARDQSEARQGKPKQSEVEFFIKDTGKPFDDPNILFEPFATTKLKGNGLGLALSSQIIYAHSGRIELDAPSKEFRIFLPKL